MPWRNRSPLWRALVAVVIFTFLLSGAVLLHYYVRFSRLIDARLSGDVFNRTALVFAAPTAVAPGYEFSLEEVARRLRRAGYSEGVERSPLGFYQVGKDFVQIDPGPSSFHKGGNAATIYFRDGKIDSIVGRGDRRPRSLYLLEPELITTLFGRSRTKRRLVRYADIPKVLRDAVIATEDRQFLNHFGINFYRILVAPMNDFRGTSTVTMQLARNFFLTRERTLKRKLAEIYISLLLEARLSKEEIFEHYSNQIYLGHRGSFGIHGFGEAARAYFDKEVSNLSLGESAFLAGIIRAPNIYAPYKHPERAKARRDKVIGQMEEIGALNPTEAEQARNTPLEVAAQNFEASQAPYLVDLVRDQLLGRFPEEEVLSQGFRVYTTLDLDLQKAASDAVRIGMATLDERLKALEEAGRVERPDDPLQPQVCLVAIDPHTGALKALVGGRNYGASQLNHALAKRQPGSSFKPFVYAAALNSAIDGSTPLITTASTIVDEPTRFEFGKEIYEPENYIQEYHGVVTLRKALRLSLNVATVKLAETIGYWKVEELATLAGFNREVEATPAVALGAYVATPIEIVGSYTVFANHGEYHSPYPIEEVRNQDGEFLWQSPREIRQVLDPRISYIMTNLLASVINRGTGGGVRRRGFNAPAAGKTGTSRDGWFVGYTSNLICAVWVGYDDDRELGLSGASSALPIWTEFMKRATEVPAYKDVQDFEPPLGVVFAEFEVPEEVFLNENEPNITVEVFIEGTEPAPALPDYNLPGVLNRILTAEDSESPVGGAYTPSGRVPSSNGEDASRLGDRTGPQRRPRRGIFRRFRGIFGGGRKKQESVPEDEARGEELPAESTSNDPGDGLP